MNIALIEIVRRFKNFVASQTPTANQIPVVGGDGATALPGALSVAGKLTVGNADSNTATAFDYALRASFTCTLTGFSGTAPSGTAYLTRINRLVLLQLPALSSATSNATTMTMTGAPVEIRPLAGSKYFLARVIDGGVTSWGVAFISPSGVITFGKDAAAAAFTATGTKGINQLDDITYSI